MLAGSGYSLNFRILQSVRGILLCQELQPLVPDCYLSGSDALGHLLQQDRELQNHPGRFAKRSDPQFHNYDILSASGGTQESAYLTSVRRHSGIRYWPLTLRNTVTL